MNVCRTFLLACAGLLTCLSPAQGTQKMIPLAKNPPKAMLSATPAGAKLGNDSLHIALSLTYRDPAGAKAFVDSVSDPTSPNYRHFITPDEVGRRFGLAQSELDKVTAYLKANGMKVRMVAKNRLSILADSTVGQAETAFSASIENFRVAPTGKNDSGSRYSFTTAPQLPSTIAFDVVDISGMENFTRPKPASLTPTQLRGLYSTASIYASGKQGQGRTIAISNWDGYRISNEILECTSFNLPVPAGGAGSNIKLEAIDGGDGYQEFEYGEGDLDIQSSIGIAPLCNLIVYDNDEASGDANLIDLLTQEADDNAADLITESYGWMLDVPTALAAHNIHLSMNAQGITYMAASGDNGTELAYPYPDTDPEVLSVGGTSATVSASNSRLTEIGWNNTIGAGGGGWTVSGDTFNVRAPFQSTQAFLAQPGAPSLSSVPYRMVPDIALNADPNTGYYVWFPDGAHIIGGTSGASPTCAGSLALTEQQLIADGFLKADGSGNFRMGRLQDLLYSYNGDGSVFFDITSGSNGQLPNGQVSNAVVGWDTDSGWGPIVFSGLIAKIEGVAVISGVKLSQATLNGGAPLTGMVSSSLPAPLGGMVVSLSSSGPDVQVPATVTIVQGATNATFNVTTNGVAKSESLYVTAVNGSSVQVAGLTLFPATYSGLTIAPSSIAGGAACVGTVSMNGSASTGGYTIYLSSSSALAKVPASVTIPANSPSANFSIITNPVATSGSAVITGTASNSKAYSATLTLTAASAGAVSISPGSTVGGSSVPLVATVTLTGPARTGGDVVALKSLNTKLATVPSSVKVAAGQTTATFVVTSEKVSTQSTVGITATLNGSSSTANLTLTPFKVTSLTFAPSSVGGGSASTAQITLNAAPGKSSGALSFKLSSSSKAATPPGSVSVAVGSTTAQFQVKTAGVAGQTFATITATLMTGVSSAGTLTINPPSLQSLSISPATVKGSSGTKVVGTVTLSGVAPAGGFSVALSSSNTGAATVPGSVTVPAGKSTATFTVTHKKQTAQTSVTVTATLNSSSSTAHLTVTPG